MNSVVISKEHNCCCTETGNTKIVDKQLQDILQRHKDKKGALMPILNDIQDSYGYLPEYALKQVSETVGISLAEIYGVATFYSRFTLKPRGEHTISVCLGTACYVKGAKEIFERLSGELKLKGSGDTTDDGKFTLEATRCLGCCGLAPVIMIDGEVYGKLVPNDIPGILNKY